MSFEFDCPRCEGKHVMYAFDEYENRSVVPCPVCRAGAYERNVRLVVGRTFAIKVLPEKPPEHWDWLPEPGSNGRPAD